jgi:hypothetical protein
MIADGHGVSPCSCSKKAGMRFASPS